MEYFKSGSTSVYVAVLDASTFSVRAENLCTMRTNVNQCITVYLRKQLHNIIHYI